jgi:hypothetical protein
MALPDLTGQNIENTYNRVVQTDGTLFYDGTGSLLNLGAINTGSFATTGSNVFRGNQVISGSVTISGSGVQVPLQISSGATSLLFVSQSGRIGIGTSTPTEALEVQGNVLIEGSTGNRLKLGAAIGQQYSLGTTYNGSFDTMFVAYDALGSPTIMTFQGNGNVGIGTTTPSARLQVRGSGATSATTTLIVQNSTPTNILTVLDNGTVGIGRTPTQTLDIAGTTRMSGSFNTAASGSILTVQGSGSAQPIFTVLGSQGELFSIVDSLSGSLFSVNDISGLPILEVFSDGTTLIGDYLDPMLITTKKSLLTNSGSFTIYSLPTASYDTAFFDYSVRSGSNARAGQIMAIQSGSSVNYTETTTTDFGTTTGLALGVFVSGSNMVLTGSAATTAWTVKTIIRSL